MAPVLLASLAFSYDLEKFCTHLDLALLCGGSHTTSQHQQVIGTISSLSVRWGAAFASRNLLH
jgi:hypothetical protein